MTDPLSIKTGLEALRTAADMLKALRAADASFEKAEWKIRIATLAESLADARMAMLDAQETIASLHAELTAARTAVDVRENIVKRENVYFVRKGDGDTGPFCPRCFEMLGKLIPVSPLDSAFRFAGKYSCPNCKATY